MNEDLYKILEVSKDANQDEIKKSFRNLSKKFHPDLNPNNKEAEEKFKKINEAYSVLSDPEKRKQYDHRGFDFNQFGGFGGFGGFGRNDGGFDVFSEFFNFNNSRKQNTNSRGSDLRIKLNFTIEEVIYGAQKTIKYSRNACCGSCSGNGSMKGNSMKQCNNCGGHGVVIQNVQTPFGRIQTSNMCSVCSGKGNIINQICNECGARGIVEKNETIELKVPSGIIEGFVYKIESGGNFSSNPNSTPGDLIIICSILEDKVYKRFGADLHRDIFVSFFDLINGNDNYVFNIFKEEIKIKIDPHTENGKVLRLKGKGLPYNNNVGDLYIHINTYVPKDLDDESKEYLSKIKGKLEPKSDEIDYDSGFMNKSFKMNSLHVN